MSEFIKPEDLPPFSHAASCPKCGFGTMKVIYHSGWRPGFPCWTRVDGEHLCRDCRRCGHGWCEATVETKPARNSQLRAVPDP